MDISKFTSQFDGGARSNLFHIQITGSIPGGITIPNIDEQHVYVKAIQLPETTVGEIPVNHMGRVYKFPGDRVYNDVQLTILSDGTDMRIRHFFEAWNHAWNRHFDNVGQLPNADNLGCNVILSQRDRLHNNIRSYTLNRVWCSDVSAVDLSHDNVDALVEFTVTLKYHYFQVTAGASGSGGRAGNLN
jgi:hypothetical protein